MRPLAVVLALCAIAVGVLALVPARERVTGHGRCPRPWEAPGVVHDVEGPGLDFGEQRVCVFAYGLAHPGTTTATVAP